MTQIRVACKLPNGITIDHRPNADGPAAVFTLKGANSPGAIGGFGVTSVDEDLFKSWLESEAGKTFAPVKNGLIFALSAKDGAGAEAKEKGADATIKTGAEPIDPTKPGKGIQPTEEQAKELAKLPDAPGGQTVATV